MTQHLCSFYGWKAPPLTPPPRFDIYLLSRLPAHLFDASYSLGFMPFLSSGIPVNSNIWGFSALDSHHTRYFVLQASGAAFNDMVLGRDYALDIFHAERHTKGTFWESLPYTQFAARCLLSRRSSDTSTAVWEYNNGWIRPHRSQVRFDGVQGDAA